MCVCVCVCVCVCGGGGVGACIALTFRSHHLKLTYNYVTELIVRIDVIHTYKRTNIGTCPSCRTFSVLTKFTIMRPS